MPRKGENIYKRKDGRWEGRFIKSYNDYVISESGKAFVDRSYCNTTSLRSSKKRLLKRQITTRFAILLRQDMSKQDLK